MLNSLDNGDTKEVSMTVETQLIEKGRKDSILIGEKRGRKEGRKEGRKDEKLDIAIRMKRARYANGTNIKINWSYTR